MCGITASYLVESGVIPNPTALKSELEASISALSHRGPDSSGTFISENGRLGLGHARLSIIDLEGGQQPLHDSDGHIHAVVNGELYDYANLRRELEQKGCAFQTFSDSELVIQLYKVHSFNLVHHLRGEFAFVLYDSQRKILFSARDRFGIKPLFYTLANGRLMIASEMKALLGFGWKAEWDVQSVLEMGELNDNRTVFKDVFKLPPAHQLICTRSGQLKVQPYWEQSYPKPGAIETRSLEEMIQGVQDHIVEAVRARLRSDTPLAIYLSGGIDSAAIAGIAAKLLREKDPLAKLATFTLAFPDREDLDEGPIAKRMAEFIGADINIVTPKEAELIARFDQAVYHIEQPVSTLHATGKMILSEHVQKQGYKVVLTGEGSDEVAAGYSVFLLDYIRAADPSTSSLGLNLPCPSELAFLLKTVEGMTPPQDHWSISDMSLTDSKLARSMFGGITALRGWATMSMPAKLFSPRTLDTFGIPDHTMVVVDGLRPEARIKATYGDWHPLNTALYASCNTLLPMLLNQLGDRSEMANSIEGRQPFLDHKYVEYINTLPPSLKIMPKMTPSGQWSFTEKWILREAVKPYVTEEIYLRKKSQYNVPISRPKQNGNAVRKELSPLQVFLKGRVTMEKVDALGFMNWQSIECLLNDYTKEPECPKDGGLDKRARVLLCVASLIILQERFKVPPAIFR